MLCDVCWNVWRTQFRKRIGVASHSKWLNVDITYRIEFGKFTIAYVALKGMGRKRCDRPCLTEMVAGLDIAFAMWEFRGRCSTRCRPRT